MIDGIEIVIVMMVLIGFVILNYRTPVVEGLKKKKKIKNLEKQLQS
jgi:hypothetical protein